MTLAATLDKRKFLLSGRRLRKSAHLPAIQRGQNSTFRAIAGSRSKQNGQRSKAMVAEGLGVSLAPATALGSIERESERCRLSPRAPLSLNRKYCSPPRDSPRSHPGRGVGSRSSTEHFKRKGLGLIGLGPSEPPKPMAALVPKMRCEGHVGPGQSCKLSCPWPRGPAKCDCKSFGCNCSPIRTPTERRTRKGRRSRLH